jgi:hypothetical protein
VCAPFVRQYTMKPVMDVKYFGTPVKPAEEVSTSM